MSRFELTEDKVNPEMEKWMKEMEEKQKPFNFIQIDFLVDMRIAEKKYKEEYREDVGGIRTAGLSFNNWLDSKKYQASKFYVESNDYYY